MFIPTSCRVCLKLADWTSASIETKLKQSDKLCYAMYRNQQTFLSLSYRVLLALERHIQ